MIILDDAKCFYKKLKKMFQEKLISGENIKTINGISILGSGDLVITEGGAVVENDYLSKKDGGTVEGETTFDKAVIIKKGLTYLGGENGTTETVKIEDGALKLTDTTDSSLFLYLMPTGIKVASENSENTFYATNGNTIPIEAINEDEINETIKI